MILILLFYFFNGHFNSTTFLGMIFKVKYGNTSVFLFQKKYLKPTQQKHNLLFSGYAINEENNCGLY